MENFKHLNDGEVMRRATELANSTQEREGTSLRLLQEMARRGLVTPLSDVYQIPNGVYDASQDEYDNPPEPTSRWLHAPDDDGETIVRGEN